MERDIANFLRRQENGEQMERDFANFLRQQENGEQMERDFANFLRQQENGEQMERVIANFLRQQENGEQMKRNFANFLRQQRESFKCFPGCMCPNLMWRHKMGKEADERNRGVIALIDRERDLPESLEFSTPFQWEPHFDSSEYYTTFPTRASVFDKIMEALNDSVVDMIGVHGTGGAGKTTMVKEVAKDAKGRGIFDTIVIAVVSKDPNTSKLLKDIAPQLNLTYKESSDPGRAGELRKALSNGNEKILVILDDLWHVLNLNEIGIPISGPNHKRCKIMLTSRRQDVFKGMGVRSTFSIGFLEKHEAWELFMKVMGDFGVKELIARKVSDRCGGLPIAILAVGAALKGEEEGEWLYALRQLQIRPLKYIEGSELVGHTPLKLSYDFLKDEAAKSCFLLCCLFPEDAEISIDDLVRYSFALGFLIKVDTLKDARIEVQAMVNKLKRSCLLINGKNKNFVKMHDVIRDLAISITEEKQTEHGRGDHDWPAQQQFIVDHDIRRWPGNDAWKHHTAISLRNNDDNFTFPCSVLHCPLMHTLLLKLGKSSLKIPNDFFQGMKAAKVLDLEGMALPSLILELDNLRMLRLKNCQLLGELATIQILKNHIEILSLEGSTIKELPQEVGELTRLRSLNLSKCRDLEVIPKGVISNLIHLEELYVAHNFKKWDTTVDGGRMSNANIVELKLLTQLIVLYIRMSSRSSRFMAQECSDLFEKLINFHIIISDGYFYGYPSFYDYPSLNVLNIYGIRHIDDEFCLLMDKVERLILWKIQDLRYLPCKSQLHITPSGGGSFSKLIGLNIHSCDRIKYLFSPSCARALQQLQSLNVASCCEMEQIIGDYYHEKEGVTDEAIIFKRLTYMQLAGLPQCRSFYPKMEKTTIGGNDSNWTTRAKSFFNEKVSFPVLERLLISMLPVEDIWNKQAIQFSKRSNKISFSQLKRVVINWCDNMVNAFPSSMLQQLQNLKTLEVGNCLSLRLLVEDNNPNIQNPTVTSKFIDVFPKLRSLVLNNLPKLMKTWLSDVDYCSYDNSVDLCLKSIKIKGCGSLRHTFSAFVAKHLVRIQDLCIRDCHGMEVIVSGTSGKGVTNDGMTEFCELQKLQLENLPNLRSFYDSKFEAPHLFNHQVIFSKMKFLSLRDLKSIGEIQLWDLLATTQEHLSTVNIIGCQVSTKISSHHQKRSFKMIEILRLQNCQGLKYVIDINGTISIGKEQNVDVKILILWDLPELVLLSNKNLNDIGGFRILKYIKIGNCPHLGSVFTHSMAMSLQHLESLEVQSCEMMEEIINIEKNNINISEKEKATLQIEFPKLEDLILFGLPNLKNFCNDERGFFSFSSLCRVMVKGCPKMKTFASGQLCLPPRRMRAKVGDEEEVEIIDLNAFFEFRNADSNHKMKAISWGDVLDYGEDDFDDYGKKYFDDDNLTKIYREITRRYNMTPLLC